tara:strand:+ start:43147 stop:43797 length:651 start_codon:yes stop_codon:yes gene_type:complete
MIELDKTRLHIYHEGRKRRMFVGELVHDVKKNKFIFTYDENYVNSPTAIPIGREFNLFDLRHESKTGKLFPSMLDRIPDKQNPAYVDYCEMTGISPDETNYIVLLGSIGRRGPSTFIYEPVWKNNFTPAMITELRTELDITQNDLAIAFDISKPTLQRVEAGQSHDPNTLKRIQIMLEFPDAALWQLKLSSAKLHKTPRTKLRKYFVQKKRERNQQ